MSRLVSPLLKCAALLCGALVLGACTTLGPDYQEPQVDWLQDWQSSAYGQADTGAETGKADFRFWWQQFNDPVLNRLIELARQENPSCAVPVCASSKAGPSWGLPAARCIRRFSRGPVRSLM